MKKIVIVAHGLSDGGAERVAANLANNFAKQGNEVSFIAAYSSDKQYKLEDKIEYKYIDTKEKNKFLKLLKRSIMIKKEINRIKPDIVISFIINELILSNFEGKYPIIYSLRIDPKIVFQKKLNRFLCKISYRRARNIVFQTPDARDFFEEKIREKGVIIGNPLTPNLPYWDKDNHKKRIITACRLTPQKNLKMLIDGFNEFNKTHNDFILELYGEGPLKENLEEYCKELQIESSVCFKGYSTDIHNIMAESTIFALTSDFEGLSNSMLEALAIGVPTICTDCPPGGAALYIKDGENGFLVDVGDTRAFTEKLSLLVDNNELQEKFSKNSPTIRNELNEENIIKKWNDLF